MIIYNNDGNKMMLLAIFYAKSTFARESSVTLS